MNQGSEAVLVAYVLWECGFCRCGKCLASTKKYMIAHFHAGQSGSRFR